MIVGLPQGLIVCHRVQVAHGRPCSVEAVLHSDCRGSTRLSQVYGGFWLSRRETQLRPSASRWSTAGATCSGLMAENGGSPGMPTKGLPSTVARMWRDFL